MFFFVAKNTAQRPRPGIKGRVVFDAEAGLFLRDEGDHYSTYLLGAGSIDQSLLQLASLGERSYNSLTDVLVLEDQLQPASARALGVERMGHWLYSYAVQGGAQSTIALTGDPIPDKAIVQWGAIYVNTVPVGVGASIAIQIEGANDFITAAAINGAPWSTLGAAKNAIPVPQTATSWIKTTTARTPSIVISAANLTAGIIDVWASYVVRT